MVNWHSQRAPPRRLPAGSTESAGSCDPTRRPRMSVGTSTPESLTTGRGPPGGYVFRRGARMAWPVLWASTTTISLGLGDRGDRVEALVRR